MSLVAISLALVLIGLGQFASGSSTLYQKVFEDEADGYVPTKYFHRCSIKNDCNYVGIPLIDAGNDVYSAATMQELQVTGKKLQIWKKVKLEDSHDDTSNKVEEIAYPAVGLENGTIKDEQIASSSDFKDLEIYRPWNARLNQNTAWCAKTQDANQYIQVTFTRKMVINGIAIQGHPTHDLRVKKYKLQYSDDLVTWKMYIENNVDKVFLGSSDAKQVKKHVLKNKIQAYIIVVRPIKWKTGICMRLEIYGIVDLSSPNGKESAALGIQSGTVVNSQFSASSYNYYDPPFFARLEGPRRWCALHSDANQWIKVTFPKRKIISGITIQRGFPSAQYAYIKTYKASYSKDVWQTRTENTAWNIWKEYKEHSVPRIFIGPSDTVDRRKQMLSHPIHAFAIKIKPISRHSRNCLRMELYGYDDPNQPAKPPGCSKLAEPLGLESGTITNDKISASSESDVYHAPRLARLNSQIKPWCAASTDVAAYLQVDLGSIMIVAGIASQGHTHPCCFVKTYQIKHAGTDLTFQLYPSNAAPKIFDGNTNHTEIVKNEINPPILARYIRVVPVTKCVAVCMRIELYGCSPTTP